MPNTIRSKTPIYILIFLFNFFLSCKGQKEILIVGDLDKIESPSTNVKDAGLQNSSSNGLDEEFNENQILFLGLNILSDGATKVKKIELNDFSIKEGRLKYSNYNQPKLAEGNLVCSLFDNSDNILFSVVFENPLIQHLEYSSEEGRFGRTVEYLDEIYYLLRIPYNRKYDHISFEYISEGMQKVRIDSISLNLKQ